MDPYYLSFNAFSSDNAMYIKSIQKPIKRKPDIIYRSSIDVVCVFMFVFYNF